MAKTKQQKKKERERRVAKKKLAEVAKRRDQDKTAKAPKENVARSAKVLTGAVPKMDQASKGKKNTFMHRRTGG